jgi:hypothetical protein
MGFVPSDASRCGSDDMIAADSSNRTSLRFDRIRPTSWMLDRSKLRSKQRLDRAITSNVQHLPRDSHWRSDMRAASHQRHNHGKANLEGPSKLAGQRVSKTAAEFMSCGMSDAAWRIADS